MDPLTISALISGGAGLMGGLFQSNQEMKMQERQNIANKELAMQAQQYERSRWHEMNRYNTPAEQMKRIEEAGLSKNLIYGSGSVSGNVSAPPPKAHIPEYQEPMFKIQNLLNVAESLASIQTKLSQNDAIQEQALSKAIENAINRTTWNTQMGISTPNDQGDFVNITKKDKKTGLLFDPDFDINWWQLLKLQREAYQSLSERERYIVDWMPGGKQLAKQEREIGAETKQLNKQIKDQELILKSELAKYNTNENMWFRFALDKLGSLINTSMSKLIPSTKNLKGTQKLDLKGDPKFNKLSKPSINNPKPRKNAFKIYPNS